MTLNTSIAMLNMSHAVIANRCPVEHAIALLCNGVSFPKPDLRRLSFALTIAPTQQGRAAQRES
jgi:hypothetical protein